jgi:hypothetical protein
VTGINGPKRREGGVDMESRRPMVRWLAESRQLFGQLPALLDELVAAEQECERLRQWVAEARAENERLRAERAELAEALTTILHQMTRPVNEIVEKLRVNGDPRSS